MKSSAHIRSLFILWSMGLVLLTDCKSENYGYAKSDEPLEAFVADTIFTDPVYPEFQDTIIPVAMRLAGICAPSDSMLPLCDATMFRAYQSGPAIPYHSSMILDVRLGAYPGARAKRVIVLENQGKQWDVINDYRGKLLELRSTPSGRYEFVVRYRHIGNAIAVLHKWNDKEGRYYPSDVEEINDHFVKPEFQDSLNNAYLKKFPWGY